MLVAHTLRAEGFDASEDGTGRGTPLVAVNTGRGYWKESAAAGTLGTESRAVHENNLVAFSNKDHGADAGQLSPTLRAMGHAESHANGGGQVAIAFTQNQREEIREVETAGALPVEPGMHQQTFLADRLGVRRLTPRECERLQGWPDDHTRYRADGSEIADGPRYRLIGNGVASPVAEWIARRLVSANT